MTCRLRNIEGLSIQSIESRVDNGYRFVVYSYSVSLILANISHISPAYFLKEEEVKKHTLKYNMLSSILGWWSLQGIPNTLKSLKTNMKGGLDVTEDIMLNLDKEDLKNRKVKIEKLYTVFTSPNKSVINNVIKIIKKTEGLNFNQGIYIGKFLESDGSSYFITFEEITDTSKVELLKNLKKWFSSHVELNISQIDVSDELNQKLIEQGQKLIIR